MKLTAKYKNKKCNGYDSIKECKRSTDLKLMLRAGLISELKEQVKFELIPKQDGERACNYICDFTYIKDGVFIVEDVKGMKTEVYKIKKKLMLQKGYRINEI